MNLSFNDERCKAAQFKAYSLFMIADGICSEEEQALLNKISEEMQLGDDAKKEINDYLSSLQISDGDNSDLVKQELAKMFKDVFSSSQVNASVQADTVWNLINLGYCDEEYSEPEKRVVQYFADKWDIKPVMMTEFIDTADTILLLTRHKEWVKKTGESYAEISQKLREIDANISLMYESVLATIAEAEAV